MRNTTKRQREMNTEVLVYSAEGHDVRASSQRPDRPEASSLEGINRNACGIWDISFLFGCHAEPLFLTQEHTWPITAANSMVNICQARE